MTLYPGTKAFAILTINSAFVAENSPHFLCQVNASSLLLNAKFKSFISSRANILVWDLQNLIVRPSRMVLNLAGNELFIYFDGAVSSTVSLQYAICVSPLFVETDSTSAFTNCGINNAWVDSTVDFASGNNLSAGNQPTYETGKFNRSLVCTKATNSTYGASILSGQTAFTVSMILKPTESLTSLQIPFADRNNAVSYLQMEIQNNAMYVKFDGGTYVVSVTSLPSYMSIGNYSLVSIVYDGSVPVASIYINGVLRGSTIDMPSSMSTYTGFVRTGFDGTNYGFRGIIDNLILRKSAVSPNYVSDQYNMLFNSSTFSTLGPAKTAGGRRNINIGIMESVNLF